MHCRRSGSEYIGHITVLTEIQKCMQCHHTWSNAEIADMALIWEVALRVLSGLKVVGKVYRSVKLTMILLHILVLTFVFVAPFFFTLTARKIQHVLLTQFRWELSLTTYLLGDSSNCSSPAAVNTVRDQIAGHIDLWLSQCQISKNQQCQVMGLQQF